MTGVSVRLLLLVIAAVLFAVGAVWTPAAPPRFSLVSAGLFFLAVSFAVA